MTSSTRREHETKGRGVGGEAQRTVRSVLGAGINSSFLVHFLSDKSKNNKKKHSERVSSGCRFQFQPHFIARCTQFARHSDRAALLSFTSSSAAVLSSGKTVESDKNIFLNNKKISFLTTSVQLNVDTLILCTKKQLRILQLSSS